MQLSLCQELLRLGRGLSTLPLPVSTPSKKGRRKWVLSRRKIGLKNHETERKSDFFSLFS